MNSFKNRKLVFGFSPSGKIQSSFNTALAVAALTARHPQATPTFPSIERTREQTRGCSGEYIVVEEINREIMRLRFGFTPSAHLLALWASLAYGVAGSPTGTPQNAKQTLVATGVGTLSFANEGLTGTTGNVSDTTTAAQLQTALEALDSIKPGNVSVTGTTLASPGLVVEFINDLALAPMPAITKTGLITVSPTTQVGSNKLHDITRSTLDAMILTSIGIGFEGDSTDADLYKNVAVNSLSVDVPKAGKATSELDLVGSAEAIAALGWTKPGCISVEPIYSRDCRVKIDGSFYTKLLFALRWSYSNNIITDADAQDWDSINIANLERGDRTTSFGFTHYGSKGDALYTLAQAEPTVPVEMHFGRPGNRFSWYAPLAKLRLDDARTTFVGTKAKSAIPISGEAFENESTGEVDYIEANIAQTGAFLTT